MQKSMGRPKLIIVCGLPGAGKTTYAKRLEEKIGAVRFCPDEWMQALSLSLHNEESAHKIEALQWALGQRLLALGSRRLLSSGGHGAGRSVTRCGREPEN